MSQKEVRELAEQEKAAREKLERQQSSRKHYFTCAGECGCTCSYEGKYDGRTLCDSCRLSSETKAFDRSVEADMERIAAERRSLQFAAKSAKKLDSGRKPMSESPIFGGTAQASLF